MPNIGTQSRLAILAALICINSAASASAGLASTILAAFDELETQDHPRVFVAPGAANDVRLNQVSGPRLFYRPASGDVSIELPAVVIDNSTTNMSRYTKLYHVAGARLGWNIALPPVVASTRSTMYAWRNTFGPMEHVVGDDVVTVNNGTLAWHPLTLVEMTGSASQPPASWFSTLHIVAARAEFESVLPPGLSEAALHRLLAKEDQAGAVAEYANHRGVVTLRVPIALHVLPESTTLLLAFLAVVTSALTRSARCRPCGSLLVPITPSPLLWPTCRGAWPCG